MFHFISTLAISLSFPLSLYVSFIKTWCLSSNKCIPLWHCNASTHTNNTHLRGHVSLCTHKNNEFFTHSHVHIHQHNDVKNMHFSYYFCFSFLNFFFLLFFFKYKSFLSWRFYFCIVVMHKCMRVECDGICHVFLALPACCWFCVGFFFFFIF